VAIDNDNNEVRWSQRSDE